MEVTSHTQTPPINPAANSTVKLTGNQCSETTRKLWGWLGRLDRAAVAVLPPPEKFKINQNENPIEILDYEYMKRIRSVFNYVVVEWLQPDDVPDTAYLVFEFDDCRAAQAWSKRLHRSRHQVLAAGEDCLRVVKITPLLGHEANLDAELNVSEVINEIVHVGQGMTAEDMNFFKSLASDSFGSVLRQLRKRYRTQHNVFTARSASIPQESLVEQVH